MLIEKHGASAFEAMRAGAVEDFVRVFGDGSHEAQGDYEVGVLGGMRDVLQTYGAIHQGVLVAPPLTARVFYKARWNSIHRRPFVEGFARVELQAYWGWLALHGWGKPLEEREDALVAFRDAGGFGTQEAAALFDLLASRPDRASKSLEKLYQARGELRYATSHSARSTPPFYRGARHDTTLGADMRVDLKKSLFILPNVFTLSSVLCGYYAILILSDQPTSDDFYRSALLIVFALFFDGIDGRVARLTKTQTAIGVQLDSLADVISFGVAPAILVYHWSLAELGTGGMLVGFVFVASGAVRLARFNVAATGDDGQPTHPGKYTQGLPIPAAAGILISIVVANTLTGKLPFSPFLISLLVITLSVFMVSAMLSVPFLQRPAAELANGAVHLGGDWRDGVDRSQDTPVDGARLVARGLRGHRHRREPHRADEQGARWHRQGRRAFSLVVIGFDRVLIHRDERNPIVTKHEDGLHARVGDPRLIVDFVEVRLVMHQNEIRRAHRRGRSNV